MVGTYPLLLIQYTTAKREIQEVYGKITNKSACITTGGPTPFRKI